MRSLSLSDSQAHLKFTLVRSDHIYRISHDPSSRPTSHKENSTIPCYALRRSSDPSLAKTRIQKDGNTRSSTILYYIYVYGLTKNRNDKDLTESLLILCHGFLASRLYESAS